MTRDEIRAAVGMALTDVTGGQRWAGDVLAADFEQRRLYSEHEQPLILGMDSLDRLELIMNIEDGMQIQITDQAAEKCKTIGDLIDLAATLIPTP